MKKYSQALIKRFFDDRSLVESDIESFNGFIEKQMQEIIEENKIIEPTIIPQNVDEFKIMLDKVWITKPEIIEADGSKRSIFPSEARLRKITYAAPIYLEVSAQINGIQRETFTTKIGDLPIMLGSKYCHLTGLSREELIKHGEDPDEYGGYFIVNGTERVLIKIEDLAPNNFLTSETSTKKGEFEGKLFSERGSFKIPHLIEKRKEGIYYITFTRVKRMPVVAILKALGMVKDEDIMKEISGDSENPDMLINLLEFTELKTQEEALDFVAKKSGITQAKDVRIERIKNILQKYFMPHLGVEEEDNMFKAKNLCKLMKRYVAASEGEVPLSDKDHYVNKRIKMSGDLLAELFRVNLKVLIGDMLYNFQRIVKRGKFPSIKVVIRDKLLTQRIYSAMATGNWVGGRKGVSQRIQRINFLDTMSHLQRVISPLSASQENFEARELHSTHLGRLCPIETPEGTNIGLRKNLSLFSAISQTADENKLLEELKGLGLESIR